MSELKYYFNIQRDGSDPDIWFPMKDFCQLHTERSDPESKTEEDRQRRHSFVFMKALPCSLGGISHLLPG